MRDLIAPLHGLRGLAAMAVLVGHVDPLRDLLGLNLAPSLGVALFFALSGFLMGHLYLDVAPTPKAMWEFAVARFARVYPLFACSVLASVAIYYVFGVSVFGVEAADILPHLALAGSGFTIWTISVEFQFYGSFLVIWAVFHLLPSAVRDAALFLVLTIFIGVVWAVGLPDGRIDLLRYFHLFAGGMAAAIVWKRYPDAVRTIAPAGLPIALAVLVVQFVAINFFYYHDYVYSDPFAIVASICAVLFAVACPTGLVGRSLSLRSLVWLGEVSFGIYLIHRFAMGAVAMTPIHDLPRLAHLVAVLALTLFAAWMANIIVERPSRDWIRDRGRRLFQTVSGKPASQRGL